MSTVKISVGGAMEEDASRRFIDAWHRAERGEKLQERHLAFESWQALAGAGLLEATPKGVRADYDAIETRIAI